MRHLIVALVVSLLFVCKGHAQIPDYLWGRYLFGGYSDFSASCSDNQGNHYCIGSYADSLTCGSAFYSPVGNFDIVLVKFDSLGNVLWSKSFGGAGFDFPTEIELDSTNNIFFAGRSTSPVLSFGTLSLTLGATGAYSNIFIAKLDSLGNPLWARGGGSPDGDLLEALTVDPQGNPTIGGGFFGGKFYMMGDSIVGSNPITGEGYFTAKISAAGNLLWLRGQNQLYELVYSLESDNIGNIYSLGFFTSDTLILGADTLFNQNPGSGYKENFMVKYDATGNVLLAKSGGGPGDDEPRDLVLDKNNNLIITGYFIGPYFQCDGDTVFNVGQNDVFVAKFDSGFNLQWLRAAGSWNDERSNSVACDSKNHIVIGGDYLSGPFDFDPTTSLTSHGGYDLFLAKYDANGNLIWAHGAGDSNLQEVHDLSFDFKDNLLCVGTNSLGYVDFPNDTLYNTSGYYDSFVLKLGKKYSSVGIAESGTDSKVSFFPNPFFSSAIADLRETPDKNTEIIIYDATGHIVKQRLITEKRFQIERDELSSGLYFYSIRNEDGLIDSGKLIIQ